MISIEEFVQAEHGSIIMFGQGYYPNLYKEKNIKWVMCKGGGNDWAVYYGKEEDDIQKIKEEGDKVYSDILIQLLTGCDNELLKLYQY